MSPPQPIINDNSYAASVFFVGVGVVYAVILVATLLSVLLIPIANATAPFVAGFVIVSFATMPGFPRTFEQVLKDFVEKARKVQGGFFGGPSFHPLNI